MTAQPVPLETHQELHFGIPVLRLHTDDPMPMPRAPKRYAVLVNPDLARYLLTFNHPENRPAKKTAIRKYARDMVRGAWRFTNEAITFSQRGVLQNGQNRLRAVIEAGVPVWFMFDFGWPEDLLQQVDRGSARTNADALAVEGVGNSSILAGAFGFAMKYLNTVATPLRWANVPPTASEVLESYRDNSDAWQKAITLGRAAYESTSGLGPSTWTAAAYVIAAVRGYEETARFFTEFIEETGEAGSPTRRLKSHYLRRKLSDTSSGDNREPMENIVRAFNAWLGNRPVGFVRTGGAFVLTPVRKV